MMRLLAVDTTGVTCSAALRIGADSRARQTRTTREHGPRLIAMVDELLVESGLRLADLDALAFGCGPGSFTGVRIAAGVIQGLALSTGLPVVPVSSLAMVAQGAMDERGANAVAVCVDARMGEAYLGCFLRNDSGLAEVSGDEVLVRPQALSLPDVGEAWVACGDGWQAFDGLAARLNVEADPAETGRVPLARHALGLAESAVVAGKAVDAAAALPVYLREKDAWRVDPA